MTNYTLTVCSDGDCNFEYEGNIYLEFVVFEIPFAEDFQTIKNTAVFILNNITPIKTYSDYKFEDFRDNLMKAIREIPYLKHAYYHIGGNRYVKFEEEYPRIRVNHFKED